MINAEIEYTLSFVSFLGKVRKIEHQRMNVYHEARILQSIEVFDNDPALIAMRWLPRLSMYTRRYLTQGRYRVEGLVDKVPPPTVPRTCEDHHLPTGLTLVPR